MSRQRRGEWLIGTSKTSGASTNAVDYTRGAKAAVASARSMAYEYGGIAVVMFKGAPVGHYICGPWGEEWRDVTNDTLRRAIEAVA